MGRGQGSRALFAPVPTAAVPAHRRGHAKLFGCPLSAGTVANMVKECAQALIETELKIKHKLRRASVIHADETELRVNKHLGYVHVASNSQLTHYAAARRRGQTAMDEINVLPRYRGTVVHDGYPSYKSYTICRHALCGVHLLRELTYFEELNEQTSDKQEGSQNWQQRGENFFQVAAKEPVRESL